VTAHTAKTKPQNILKITNQRRAMKLKFGWGKWDSWGIGLFYCNYDKSICLELVHWYFYVELWTKKDFK
jgi:hypothetical protein